MIKPHIDDEEELHCADEQIGRKAGNELHQIVLQQITGGRGAYRGDDIENEQADEHGEQPVADVYAQEEAQKSIRPEYAYIEIGPYAPAYEQRDARDDGVFHCGEKETVLLADGDPRHERGDEKAQHRKRRGRDIGGKEAEYGYRCAHAYCRGHQAG